MVQKILSIGAAHVDIAATLKYHLSMGQSNPVRVQKEMGGIAFNLAHFFRRQKIETALISCWGEDDAHLLIQAELEKLGIDIAASKIKTTKPTASYTALLAEDGDLVVGIADVDIYDEITIEDLKKDRSYWDRFDILALDSNFSEEVITWIGKQKKSHQKLCGVIASPAKGLRFKSVLPYFDALFLNRSEAISLLDRSFEADENLRRAEIMASDLVKRGVEHVFLTDGKRGVFYGSQMRGKVCCFPAPTVAHIKNVSGAGDAFAAGVMSGLARHGDFSHEIIEAGLLAAKAVLESDRPVS